MLRRRNNSIWRIQRKRKMRKYQSKKLIWKKKRKKLKNLKKGNSLKKIQGWINRRSVRFLETRKSLETCKIHQISKFLQHRTRLNRRRLIRKHKKCKLERFELCQSTQILQLRSSLLSQLKKKRSNLWDLQLRGSQERYRHRRNK